VAIRRQMVNGSNREEATNNGIPILALYFYIPALN
jgi:hypothetical protein